MAVKIENPLIKYAWVKGRDGEDYWVDFKYEQLFAFYFNYRKLDHTIKSCKVEKSKKMRELYGAWMRANQGKS